MHIVPHLCNRVLVALEEADRVFMAMEHFLDQEGAVRPSHVDRLEMIMLPLRDVLLENVRRELELHRGGDLQIDFFCRMLIDSVRRMQTYISECCEESLTMLGDAAAHAACLDAMVAYVHCLEGYAKFVRKVSCQIRSVLATETDTGSERGTRKRKRTGCADTLTVSLNVE